MFTNQIIIRSPLTREEAVDRLVAATDDAWDSHGGEKTLFYGNVSPDGFRIAPILTLGKGRIRVRDSFLPLIDGTITAAGKSSELRAKAHLVMIVKLFLLIWVGGFSVMLFFAVRSAISGKTPFWAPLIALGILAAGIGLAYFGYAVPEKKAEARLRKLLEAEQETRK